MRTQYTITDNNHRRWVMAGAQPIGAVAVTPVRSYIYPLFTPAGTIVLQECPPDHPHHQGIMVGQDFVNGHNFWAMGHVRYPLNFQSLGDIQETTDDTAATFALKLRWATKDGQAILHEERTARFESWDGFHFVDVTSTWHAIYGDLFVSKTKEGGLGMRVHPQLETVWGGTIRSSAGETSEKQVFDTRADWIEVGGSIAGKAVGVVMMPHPSQPQIPWFVRDYGLHLYNPYRHQSAKIPAGGQVSLRVGFAAYDGKSDGSQAARAWELYRGRP